MVWATFWAIFTFSHLVTLASVKAAVVILQTPKKRFRILELCKNVNEAFAVFAVLGFVFFGVSHRNLITRTNTYVCTGPAKI
jgi:hypothetical protein